MSRFAYAWFPFPKMNILSQKHEKQDTIKMQLNCLMTFIFTFDQNMKKLSNPICK